MMSGSGASSLPFMRMRQQCWSFFPEARNPHDGLAAQPGIGQYRDQDIEKAACAA